MSKKFFLGIVVIILIALVYFFVFNSSSKERVLELVSVENDVYALSFDYLSGPDGYERIESATSDDFLHSYVFVQQSELIEYQNKEEEIVPPTISVFVFKLPDTEEVEGERPGRITRLQNWAQDNAGLTAFGQIYGTPDIIEIDGVKALEYTTDGMYQQSVFLASYQGFIYMFVGQYDRPTDIIKQDFETLLTTIRFE